MAVKIVKMKNENKWNPLIKYISDMLGKIVAVSTIACAILALIILALFIAVETHPEFGGFPEHFFHMCIAFVSCFIMTIVIPWDDLERLDLISLLIVHEKYNGIKRKDGY